MTSQAARLILAALIVLAVLWPFTPPPTPASVLAEPRARQLDEVAQLIRRHYLRVIPPDSLTDAARRCFLGTLDPYSSYLDARATNEFETALEGRFGGVGIGLAMDTARAAVYVTLLYRNSPALAAGIHVGDTLVAVDGRPAHGRDFFDVLAEIRGKVGTPVNLDLRRTGESADRRFSLRRAVISTPSVHGLTAAASEEARYLADAATRTAYVRIEYFDRQTPFELDTALAAVQRIGARALVLDLRDDPGGTVRGAVGVADRFLDSVAVVTMRARGKPEEILWAHAGAATRLPLALLINSHTQSASEILASSLQDNGRAIVVGSRSFGKGVALQLYHLKRTPGLVKLTNMVYVRPSGRPMERQIPWMNSELAGVWPDSGLAITIPEAEEDRWREATYRVTDRILVAVGPPDTTTAPPDRVLMRAVEALKSMRSRK